MGRSALVMVLSALVVFAVTAFLIVPGMALDQDEAEVQGGIDVPAAEQTAEAVEQTADVTEQTAEAAEPEAARATGSAEATEATEQTGEAGSAKETEAAGRVTTLDQAGDDYRVSVTYGGETGIPEGAELRVKEIVRSGDDAAQYDRYLAKTEKALGWDAGSASYARLFDIDIVKDGKKLQPDEGTSVDVEIELADREGSGETGVVHFGEKPEVIEADSEGNTVSFAAEGFSIYSVVENDHYARLVYYFHNGADIVSTQYLKKYVDTDGSTQYERLYDPGLEPSYGQRFVGWAEAPDETDGNRIYTLAQLNEDVPSRLDDAEHSDQTEVHFYAIMDEAYYLRYMNVDAEGNVSVLHTETRPAIVSDPADQMVDINYKPDIGDSVYEGWYDPAGHHNYSEDLYHGEASTWDTIRLDHHLDLYLDVQGRFWLVFDSNAGGAGSGTTYTPPQLLYSDSGDVTVKPADPTRKGYIFTGWNTAEDGSGTDWLTVDRSGGDVTYPVNRFGDSISEDVILYAQWEPAEADYNVVFWVQKADATGTDPATDYDYVSSETRRAHTGDNVALTNADKTRVLDPADSNYADHYVLNEDNSDMGTLVVEADGTTTLHVYVDRKEYTLRFFYAREYDSNAFNGYNYNVVGQMNNGYAQGWTVNNNTTYYTSDGRQLSRTNTGRLYIDGAYYTGTVYTRGTARNFPANHYVQVNCNNEGFLQWRNGNRNLNTALTYRGNNDYQLLDGSNTWKDVNNSQIAGDPQNLVDPEYLAKPNVSLGSMQINNVTTDVVGNSMNSNVQSHSMTYHYLDVQVRYGQSLTDLWPSPADAFVAQDMTTYNKMIGGYTEIVPLLEGSRASGGNISGIYSTMDDDLLVDPADDIGYFLTYWRYENPRHYLYNVYFSALEDETADTTRYGNDYVLQDDKTYVVANGQGWGNTNKTDSGQGYWDVDTVSFDGTTVDGRVDVQNQSGTYDGMPYEGVINVYYTRNEHSIHYVSEGQHVHFEDHQISGIPFGTDLTKYAQGNPLYYEPDPSIFDDGFFFAGWYVDEACTIPYDFTGVTMPDHDITVYGKVDTYRARVVLVPTKDNEHNDDVYFPNDQGLTFRLDYGETVSDVNISPSVAVRNGYKLVGWYTTPDFQDGTEWNFETPIDRHVEAVDMDYQNSEEWANNTYGDNDGRHPEVRGLLKLYAKWELAFEENDLFIEYEVPERYVLRNAQGNLITNIPADTNTYRYDESSPNNIHVQIKGRPTDYNETFEFTDWMLLNGDGTESGTTYNPLTMADLPPSAIQYRTITDDEGNERTMRVIVLRGQFILNENNKGTEVVFDGNGGATPAGQESVREVLLVNEGFNIPDTGSFVREGYVLRGWSFHDDTTVEEFEQAVAAAGSSDDPEYLAKAGMFTLGQDVAADNLTLSEDNNWDPLANTIYAIWEPNRFTVTVHKVVEDEAETDKDFAFTTTGLEEIAAAADRDFTLVNGGTKTIAEVPYGTRFTLTETPYTGYAVKSVEALQTSDAEGEPLAEEDYIDLAGSDGKEYEVKGDIEITYTNKHSAVPVRIVKIDQEGAALEHAVFDLTGPGVDETGLESTIPAGGEEAVIYENEALAAGEYILSETFTPAGYNAPEGDVVITVDDSGAEIVVTAAIAGEPVDPARISKDQDTGEWTVQIMNTAGVELPSTGGPGTALIYAVGILLMLLAGAGLAARRRVNG